MDGAQVLRIQLVDLPLFLITKHLLAESGACLFQRRLDRDEKSAIDSPTYINYARPETLVAHAVLEARSGHEPPEVRAFGRGFNDDAFWRGEIFADGEFVQVWDVFACEGGARIEGREEEFGIFVSQDARGLGWVEETGSGAADRL